MDLRRVNIRLKDLAERSRLDKQSQISGLSASGVVRRALAFYMAAHSVRGHLLPAGELRSPEDAPEAYQFDNSTGKWEFVGLPSEDELLRITIEERVRVGRRRDK
jgi:hypothetical protein